jgi:hypothetical protein
LTFGFGIIILQGVSRRKSLAGVNIMKARDSSGICPNSVRCKSVTQVCMNDTKSVLTLSFPINSQPANSFIAAGK